MNFFFGSEPATTSSGYQQQPLLPPSPGQFVFYLTVLKITVIWDLQCFKAYRSRLHKNNARLVSDQNSKGESSSLK